MVIEKTRVGDKIAIYFYKSIFGKNKYICTSSVNNAQQIDLLFGSYVEVIKKKVPKWNLGTYLIIKGYIFKI